MAVPDATATGVEKAVDQHGEAPDAPGAAQSDMVQLVAPDGSPVQRDDYAVLADDEGARAMLREMVLARRLDLEATNLQRQNELGMWPPMQGQEGTQAGVGAALGAHDHVWPSYREHGLALNRGVDPVDILGLFRGTSNGLWDFDATRFEGYTLVVGAQVLHAVGHAMGLALDGLAGPEVPEDQRAATLVFHGDGASSQGEVNEGYVFAASYQAPVVFLCQNNHWAISEPVTRQSRIPLYRRADGFGIPGVRVDGNDPLAVQAVVGKALERARKGEGPTLVEAVTYRMGPHTTSDDPRRYRGADEVEQWGAKDPIARLENFLRRRDALDQDFLDALHQEADDFGADLRARVRALPVPDFADSFSHVYVEDDPDLARQLREHRDFQQSLEGAAE